MQMRIGALLESVLGHDRTIFIKKSKFTFCYSELKS
jgi:hypothetical protein